MLFILILCFLTVQCIDAGVWYKVKATTEHRTIYGPLEKREWVKGLSMGILHMDHFLAARARKFVQGQFPNSKIPMLAQFQDNYNEIIPGVILGSLPMQESTVQNLTEEYNVSAVVNMLGDYEYQNTQRYYEKFGWNELQLPTPDHRQPRVEDLEAGVAFLKSNLAQNSTIYVHCQHGRLRSSLVVFALLVDLYAEKSLDELQLQMSAARPIVDKDLPTYSSITVLKRKRLIASMLDGKFMADFAEEAGSLESQI